VLHDAEVSRKLSVGVSFGRERGGVPFSEIAVFNIFDGIVFLDMHAWRG